jgi:aryl-alcohol dehydrogenase-like predicted oxidoreductase
VPGKKGLSEKWILRAADESLKRLGVDEIDLYFSHWPDSAISHEETLGAYDKLLKAGKVRAIGASNYKVEQLGAALTVAEDKDLPSYQVLQPEYNLYDRNSYDGSLREFCINKDLGVITYYSLASGFLSGKYRSSADLGKSKRGEGIAKYLNERGLNILKALDVAGARHQAKPAEIALAWLMTRKGVTAPIASATSVAQVESFAKAANLILTIDDIAALDTASLDSQLSREPKSALGCR